MNEDELEELELDAELWVRELRREFDDVWEEPELDTVVLEEENGAI